MPLANPIVSRLAAGDSCDGEVCGLLLVMNWPASCIVQGKLDVFKEAVLPAAAYLYPPSSLHCTVATLRAFTGGPLSSADNGARQTEAARWAAVLDAAAAAPSWPSGPITLRMLAPQFEGAAGIIRYEEVSPGGKVEAMRGALRDAIAAAGGVAAEGSSDRSLAKALPGAPSGEPPPHLPNIIHSTVLRWASEPSEQDIGTIRAAFERIASCWEALEFSVDASEVRAVYEDVPFMHIAHDAAQVFWAPPSAKLESQSLQRDK